MEAAILRGPEHANAIVDLLELSERADDPALANKAIHGNAREACTAA